MDEPFGVGIGQPTGNLRNHRGGSDLVECPILEHLLAEVDAFDEFGDEVVDLSIVPGIERTDEVWMIEPTEHADLSSKRRLGIGRRLRPRQHLDGDLAPHHRVLRTKHLPHPSLAEDIEDPVLTEGQLPAAGEHLRRLEAGQCPPFHEHISHRLIPPGRIAPRAESFPDDVLGGVDRRRIDKRAGKCRVMEARG